MVEDEVVVAMLIEDILLDWGAIVVGPAGRVAQALDLLAQGPVDAAILDVNLGGETTFGVAQELARRGVPFAFATGYGQGVQLPPALSGTVPVIPKPYRADDIAKLVSRVLEKT